MLVALCGAYRNCGDHLIGSRARTLLKGYVDDNVVTIDRKEVTDDHYRIFNNARAVMLCGGPAYQREMYPKVYPIDRERITVPIIPFGLGWKAPAKKAPETFRFEPEAAAFISDIHSRIDRSSARDPLTVEVLGHAGVENVSMTGCPAWYDLAHIGRDYSYRPDVKNLVLSMPAIMQPGVEKLVTWLTARFPDAKRTVSFHHGLVPNDTAKGQETGKVFQAFAARAECQGWEIADLAESLARMEALYRETDFHIGYRVHAHIFCLSQRTASILINEDARGVGQCKAMDAPNLMIDAENIDHIKDAVENHFEKRGETVSRSVAKMEATFPKMREFLTAL